jgi:hypothetical protein
MGSVHVKIETFLIADAAEVGNWLLNVRAGGWEHYTCGTKFPSTVQGALAGVAVLSPDELRSTPLLTATIAPLDNAGDLRYQAECIFGLGDRPTTAEGVSNRLPFVFPFGFGVDQAGVMRVVLSENGVELDERTFYVREARG